MDLEGRCVILLDGGTTQTRAWAVRGGEVIAAARAAVGARDTARDGSPVRLQAGVTALVREVSGQATRQGAPPALIAAAGMITSAQGLVEVPHVGAPAGAAALAAGVRRLVRPDLAPLPFLFIPGVRSGPPRCDPDDVLGADVMRGEEVLALGLPLPVGGLFLNLGSHWKAIRVDGQGRIAGSVSTLSGELIHAVQTQTVLASALPPGRPEALPPAWVDAGARAFAAAGLPRALYAVRLLEMRASCTADERMAYLVGAVIAADRAALTPAGDGGPVLLVGAPALAAAWARALPGREVRILDEAEIEAAFRAGCLRVLAEVPEQA